MDSLCGESAREMERFAVTAAAGALGPVLVKLAAFLGDEYTLLKETRLDIMSIKSGLEPVHDLLGRLWGREDLDEECKDWMMEARELSYDIEDGINNFTLGLERGDSGLIQREPMDNPFKEFMGSVKGVSERCSEMEKIGEAFVFNYSKLTTDPRALFLHKDASELVGMEKKEEELIKLLHQHEMVCIVGFAGMGKTTLADLVYHAKGDAFQCRAFVSVHPSPKMTDILGTILSQVTKGATSAGTEAAAEQIINDISIFLSDKKYLVIVDDVWHWEQWQVIRKALSKNNLGCKIIMTTRVVTIAEKCETEQGAHVYTQYFDRGKDITLSYMTLKKCLGEAKAHGLSIAALAIIATICEDMPLAVICFSSALAESHVQGDYREWETWVSRVMNRFLSTASLKPLVQSLCLGFDDLPVHLRTCLLYCSIYPPHYQIERYYLVRKWVAEGFVSQQEVAEAYFDKLVSRNLLQLHPDGGNMYHVHPVMQAFLVCKAKEDNFVAYGQYNGPLSTSRVKQQIRRLSLRDWDSCPNEDVSHTRTLVAGYHVRRYLSPPQGSLPKQIGVLLKKFKNLRVLVNEGARLQNDHLVDIGGLIWLRYLSLTGCYAITELPREIGRLQNLETLDISSTDVMELPTEIGELQCLKTLNISHTEVTELPREIMKLESLENLDVSYTEVRELPKEIGKLQRLKTLNIRHTQVTELPREIMKLKSLENLDVSYTRVRELLKEIGKLQRLKTLDIRMTKVRELYWEGPNSVINVVVGDISSPRVVKLLPLGVEEVIISSSGANCRKADLSVFALFNHFGTRCEVLPVPMHRLAGRHMNVPQCVKQDLNNVSSLDIRLCKLEQGDLHFLKKMPNLQALELRFEVLPREPIAITGGGFSKLETFYVDCRLPRVTFQHGAMPKLKHLEFKFYTGPASQAYSSMGIAHLPELEKVVFRCSEYYTSDGPGITATIEVVRKEAAEHPNDITLYIDGMDSEVFGSGATWISLADKRAEKDRDDMRLQLSLAAEWRAKRHA